MVLGIIVGAYLLIWLLLQVYGVNSWILMGLCARSLDRRRREERALLEQFAAMDAGDRWPVVTTQLPIYNERHVVERLIRAVCDFDYPPGRHEIQVLDDSTDDTVEIVAREVARHRAAGVDIVHLRRGHRQGFKAGALAEGLRRARGELVAIFDADFVPSPDFLRRTVPFLAVDPRCGFVQTRWGHRNRHFSLLTRVQSLGIDGHFVVEQAARSGNGLLFNFNGTAGIWRRDAIDAAGGWQADTLTEDLDLSYRVLLAGWRSRLLVDVITPAEIPTDMNALKSQQYRWAKGSIQAARKLLPAVWARSDFPLFKRIEATLHLTQYVIHPLVLVLTLLILPLVWVSQNRIPGMGAVPLVALMFVGLLGPSMLYVFAQAVSRGSLRLALACLPALASIGIGLAVNNTRAVLSGLFRSGGDFVRTPKLGALAETPASRRAVPLEARRTHDTAYRPRFSRTFWVEVVMGLWALAAFVGSFFTGTHPAGPFLLLQAAGFLYVGIVSVVHQKPRT